jgi:hypothetical protein
MLIIQQRTTTANITLDPIPTTVFTTTQTAVSCNGGADGTITVNVTAGEGPYEYQLILVDSKHPMCFRIKCRNSVCGDGTYARQCLESSAPITITEPALTATDALHTTRAARQQ